MEKSLSFKAYFLANLTISTNYFRTATKSMERMKNYLLESYYMRVSATQTRIESTLVKDNLRRASASDISIESSL